MNFPENLGLFIIDAFPIAVSANVEIKLRQSVIDELPKSKCGIRPGSDLHVLLTQHKRVFAATYESILLALIKTAGETKEIDPQLVQDLQTLKNVSNPRAGGDAGQIRDEHKLVISFTNGLLGPLLTPLRDADTMAKTAASFFPDDLKRIVEFKIIDIQVHSPTISEAKQRKKDIAKLDLELNYATIEASKNISVTAAQLLEGQDETPLNQHNGSGADHVGPITVPPSKDTSPTPTLRETAKDWEGQDIPVTIRSLATIQQSVRGALQELRKNLINQVDNFDDPRFAAKKNECMQAINSDIEDYTTRINAKFSEIRNNQTV